MNTIQEIEKAIKQLPKEDLDSFREWFEKFDAAAWDKQLEADVKAGKLDKLANKAIADYHAGKCKEI